MNQIGPPLHDDRPRVVAFGSGKGGTGKTTLCADIARALTRYNFRVLCVDNSWSAPSLNIHLACPEPNFGLPATGRAELAEPDSHIAEFIVPTGFPSVYLASLAATRNQPFSPPRLNAEELLLQLHQLDFDWVLIDLSDGLSSLDIGLFTLSDIPILVGTPEPASLRLTTQFLRSALFHAIGFHPDAPALRGELAEILCTQPLDYRTQDLRYDAPSADSRRIIDETLHRLEPYLIVNMIREGAEHDLGYVFGHALHHVLQIFPRVLATLDYADRRWFYNRRTTGLNATRNEDGVSNEVEMLARNIRDISLVDLRYPRPIPPRSDEAHPALRMGLNPDLSRNEVRQYCRRLWEGYRRENSISLIFNDPEERLRIADRLESLYRQVLTMPSESFSKAEVDETSRRMASRERPAKARTVTPPRSPASTESEPPEHEPLRQPPPQEQASDSPEPPKTSSAASSTVRPDDNADAPSEQTKPSVKSPGKTLAKLRRDHSMSLHELSSRTHIGVKYLAAIEEIDANVLPRRVYLRGYLREIARVYGIDPEKLLDDYLNHLDSVT